MRSNDLPQWDFSLILSDSDFMVICLNEVIMLSCL